MAEEGRWHPTPLRSWRFERAYSGKYGVKIIGSSHGILRTDRVARFYVQALRPTSIDFAAMQSGKRFVKENVQLFLDCDGVLADFDTAALQVFGLPTREAERKLGTSRFWRMIREHEDFYGTLPLKPDARCLFDAVKHLNPIILTGCPMGDWAESQKRRWARTHFPGTKMITCLAREKWLHMKPGDILVDDFVKYRDLWERAGGLFVHHTSAEETIAALIRIGLLSEDSPI